MQPDIDELLAANVRRAPGPSCSVCNALREIDDPAVVTKLGAALADRAAYTDKGLMNVINKLVAAHLQVCRSAVGRHRNRECKAGRADG